MKCPPTFSGFAGCKGGGIFQTAMTKKISFWSIIFAVFLTCTASSAEKAENMEKEQAEATINLAEAYMGQGNYTAALKELLKVEKFFPDNPYLHNDLGLVYLAKEKPELAVEHFKKAVKINPDYAPARNNLGTAYLVQKNWDAAIEIFKTLSDDLLYGTPHYPLSNLGWAYYNKGDYRTAEKYYADSLKTEPDFVTALRGLGRTYIALKEYAKAVENLEKAIRILPRFAEAWLDLGDAYIFSRDYQRAIAAYQKVIELSPNTPLAEKAESRLKK
jgi:Tfp pilus assembly protein PilF